MPYVTPARRALLGGSHVFGAVVPNAGDLNFVLTRIIIEYMEGLGLRYQTINDIVGALDGAKAEFRRRVVDPYEDTKIKENGDVYPS